MFPPPPPPPDAAAAAAVAAACSRLLLVDQVLDVRADPCLLRLERMKPRLDALALPRLRRLVGRELRRLGLQLGCALRDQRLRRADLLDQVAVGVVLALHRLYVVDQLAERVGREQIGDDVLAGRLVGGRQALGERLLGAEQVVPGDAEHDAVVLKRVARVQVVLVDRVVLLDLLLERGLLGHDLALDLAGLRPLGRDARRGDRLGRRGGQRGGGEGEHEDRRPGRAHSRCARLDTNTHGLQRYQTSQT